MDLKTVLLESKGYQEFLAGNEVECTADHINNKNITMGEHIMVYKDSLANATELSLPTREKQSEYVGIEGTVTAINSPIETDASYSKQTLRLKKL